MKFALAKITAVKALPRHRLAVTFADGAEGVFDCASDLWGEVFEPLKDQKIFTKVYLDHGAPTWPNGADIDPGVIREAIEQAPVSRKAVARNPRSGRSTAVREEPSK